MVLLYVCCFASDSEAKPTRPVAPRAANKKEDVTGEDDAEPAEPAGESTTDESASKPRKRGSRKAD